MILRCPRCGGQHLEFDLADPMKRRCACGHEWRVEDDLSQVEPLANDPRWTEPKEQAA